MTKQVKKIVAGSKSSTKTAKKSKKAVVKIQKSVQKVAVKLPEKIVQSSQKEELTPADKIWAEIKNKDLIMFGIMNQPVSKYCSPVTVDPNVLYLHFTVSSVIAPLEQLLKNKYDVELVDKFITVSPKKAETVISGVKKFTVSTEKSN